MYDELVKRLRMQAEVERFFTGEPMLYEQAADAIEELSKPQWIPVTERLPDGNGDYIVYCIGGNYNQTSCISLAYFGGEHFYVDLLSVTHWMPLPEPPKGDET